ncbi:hypothetical protein NMG60_11021888 [Bertholletia excelsa]
MSTVLEHDYIGLSGVSSMENSQKLALPSEENKRKNDFKATELRLGLPGSESRERDADKYPLGAQKGLVSGAKRGFSGAIIGGSGKWIFTGSGGSEIDLTKNGGLFSPRALNVENSSQKSAVAPTAVKESVPPPSMPALDKKGQASSANSHGSAPAAKAQVVGWPPIRSFRKNSMASTSNNHKVDDHADAKSGSVCFYVKVSMDGAPYLRKIDLKTYSSYKELYSGLEKMFCCFSIGQCGSDGLPGRDGLSQRRLMDLLHGSDYVLTYEDKDGDWMLVGDVPWEMFTDTCKRLRIMKSSEAIGLAPRAMDKHKNM